MHESMDTQEKVPRVESPEERSERYAGELRGFFHEMQKNSLVPEAMFQQGKEYGVAEGTTAKLERPFGVFRVAEQHQKLVGSGERAIFKTQMESEPRAGMDREVAFYQRFLPRIQENLSPDVREGLVFPKLMKVFENADGKAKAILLSELQGEIMGVHDYGFEGKATPEDFQRIIELVRAVQHLPVEELRELSPSTSTTDHANREAEWFTQDKVDIITRNLGEGYDTKSLQTIAQGEQFIREQPERVLSEDVFQTNLMVMPDGRTGSFDWERLKVGTNPGHDYSKFASRMWTEPEKQSAFIRAALEANADMPGFKEMFKSNLLATEYSHLFRHYAGILEKHAADPNRYATRPHLLQEAQQAAPALAQSIRELLDNTGPWAEAPEEQPAE